MGKKERNCQSSGKDWGVGCKVWSPGDTLAQPKYTRFIWKNRMEAQKRKQGDDGWRGHRGKFKENVALTIAAQHLITCDLIWRSRTYIKNRAWITLKAGLRRGTSWMARHKGRSQPDKNASRIEVEYEGKCLVVGYFSRRGH